MNDATLSSKQFVFPLGMNSHTVCFTTSFA